MATELLPIKEGQLEEFCDFLEFSLQLCDKKEPSVLCRRVEISESLNKRLRHWIEEEREYIKTMQEE